MRSPDYLLKSIVIKEGLHKKVNRINCQKYNNLKEGIVYDPVLDQQYMDLLSDYGYASMLEAKRINHASYTRIKRLKDRIMSYLSMGQCIFITLTFRPSALKETTEKQRRIDVSRFLKSVSQYYVANIDYGVDDRFTKREHYHALVVSDWVDGKWKHGRIHRERVRLNEESTDKKISKYISKLTNHAIKDSTKRCCYIYSRG